MTAEASPVFGSLTIDDLAFADGSTRWAVPGGNAAYSALGATSTSIVWKTHDGAINNNLSRSTGPVTLSLPKIQIDECASTEQSKAQSVWSYSISS
jgi:hypothetical protein